MIERAICGFLSAPVCDQPLKDVVLIPDTFLCPDLSKNLALILVLMSFFLGCQSQASHPESLTLPNDGNSGKLDEDSVLIEKIKTFSEDTGEQGQKALAYLRSLPQDKLIRDLLRLRSNLPPDDSLQPQIAFVFCHLDYEYRSNAEIVATALSRNNKYRNFYGDQAASLIARLIKRGDKELLTTLFSSVPWADGALAEELSVTFGSELTNDTESFLIALNNQPAEIRFKIYELIDRSGTLTSDEKQNLENRLRKVGPKTRSYRLAQEILTSRVIE